ncbi:uncharacterized protein [Chiloscyllium punctatum]|uniref:HTH CENPB-type domain-containing protein n=1 Tax=Chiloscyllium punctatum TaxID=137246 RepID=A0A401S4W0_CHIPU|nr:hypothetical protein [Chiloscyllium punctatum]
MARNELSMKQKVELILQSEGKSQRQLAGLFNIGKTQVQTILKRKAEILQAYQGHRDTARKRLCVRLQHGYLNLTVCRWLQRVRAQGLAVNGPAVQRAALRFAKELGIPDFKASNGWLRSFRSRNISFESFCDERAGVQQTWKLHAKLSGHTRYSPVVLPSPSLSTVSPVWVVSGNEVVPGLADLAVASGEWPATSAPSSYRSTGEDLCSPSNAVSISNCQSELNDYHKAAVQQKTQTFRIAMYGQPDPTPPELTLTPSITKWAVTRMKTVPSAGNSLMETSNPALTRHGNTSPNPLESSKRSPTSHMNAKSKNQSLKGLKMDGAAQILSNHAVTTTGSSNGQREIKMTTQSGVGQSHAEEYDTTIPQEMHKKRLEEDVDLSRVKSELVDCSTDSGPDGENLLRGHPLQSLVAEPIVLPFSGKDSVADFGNEDPRTSTLLQQQQVQSLSNSTSKFKDLHSTQDNGQLEILKTLLKLTTKERDSYKTQNDNLLRRIHGLENQLMELTQKNLKKNLCHKWTQSDFELISNSKTTSNEIC